MSSCLPIHIEYRVISSKNSIFRVASVRGTTRGNNRGKECDYNSHQERIFLTTSRASSYSRTRATTGTSTRGYSGRQRWPREWICWRRWRLCWTRPPPDKSKRSQPFCCGRSKVFFIMLLEKLNDTWSFHWKWWHGPQRPDSPAERGHQRMFASPWEVC